MNNFEIGVDSSLCGADIQVYGTFHLGDRSILGNNVTIRGNNVTIGDDFYSSGGLTVGGGGNVWPSANLAIGNRCTIHNSMLNVCESITIGDDVGLSPHVDILTHGFWLSALEGYPAKFAPVVIESGVIVGWRSLILPGVTIGKNAVVGAQSVVTKDLEGGCIYAGGPARFINRIEKPGERDVLGLLDAILARYEHVARHHGVHPSIAVDFPWVQVNRARFNVVDFSFSGAQDEETDDFRDYMRRWGIRLYTGRPFRSL